MRKPSFKRPLIVSLILHGFALLLFILISRDTELLNARKSPETLWVLEGAPSKGRSSQPPSRRSESILKPRKSLDLGLAPSKNNLGTQHGKAGKNQYGSDGYAVANGMGLKEEGKLYPFFESLWNRVDSLTTYPADFVDQGIQGKVTVQLEVDRRGVFTGNILSIRGDDPMITAMIVTTLAHALKEPLPAKQWMNRDQIMLVFQFEFNLIGVGSLPQKVDHAHIKNILSFRREAHVDPAINRAIEKLFTRYIPPILPIPGGFFIDFPHAFLYVKNLIHSEPDPGDLRQERLNLRKSELEQLIQRDGLNLTQ